MGSHANGQAFNIGSEHAITIRDLAHKIRDLAGSSSPIVYVSYAKAYGPGYEDMPVRMPDLTRSRNVLNYEPSVSLDEGLKLSIDWFREQMKDGNVS